MSFSPPIDSKRRRGIPLKKKPPKKTRKKDFLGFSVWEEGDFNEYKGMEEEEEVFKHVCLLV